MKINDKVYIKDLVDSWAAGEWGIITSIDGDEYYVNIAGGGTSYIFEKSELKKLGA